MIAPFAQKRMAVIIACDNSNGLTWLGWLAVWLLAERSEVSIENRSHLLGRFKGHWYHLSQRYLHEV